MDPEKKARLEAAGFHITDDPRDLVDPLAVIGELRARLREAELVFRGAVQRGGELLLVQENLVALALSLANRLRHADPDSNAPNEAVDYLRRNNLLPPLR